MTELGFTGKGLAILDFDIECRPMGWYGGEFVTKQPTAIAWKFIGTRAKPTVMVIGESFDTRQTRDEEADMLLAFRKAYESADMVTGHYIRSFDLPTIQGALLRLGLPLLDSKLTQDTKADVIRTSGISKSQENLCAMFETAHPKIPMNTTLWFEANELRPEGIMATKKRVKGDVLQHIELRENLIELGAALPPRMWVPGANQKVAYHP